MSASSRRFAAAATVVLLTLVVFWPARSFDFVSYDDPTYVTGNARVLGGPTPENVRWTFTTTYFSNWHPLTWLSLMLDARLFGADPHAFHRTSIWLHALSVLLLFLLFERMTGECGKSAFIAALFAVHPLHVEPVAWISSRKDLLSTAFGLLCLLGWVAWVRGGGRVRYVLALAAYAASLLSKQMLVTLPFLLVLFDLWPLGRIEWNRWPELVRGIGRRLPEKIPFFLLAAALSAAAYFAQQSGGAIRDMRQFPLAGRLANAATVYVIYAWKTLWPAGLAAFYPYPPAIPSWRVAAAALILAVVTVAAVRQLRRRPWLAVGWLWYLGTLVPVIGLVQIGEQQMADRYTYVPLVGLFAAATWGAATFFARPRLAPVVAASVLCAFALTARLQLAHWRDSSALFRQAVAATRNNAVAHNNLGTVLGQAGKLDAAMAEFRKALAADPDFADAHSNLGMALLQLGRMDEAAERFREALRLDPDLVAARMNYGLVLERSGRLAEAVEQYDRAVELSPESVELRRHAAAAHDRLRAVGGG